MKEETGLQPVNIFIADHMSSFYESYEDRINLVPVFGIEVDIDKVELSHEHSKYKWVDYKKARKKLTWQGQKKGIKAVFKMLNSRRVKYQMSSVINKIKE